MPNVYCLLQEKLLTDIFTRARTWYLLQSHTLKSQLPGLVSCQNSNLSRKRFRLLILSFKHLLISYVQLTAFASINVGSDKSHWSCLPTETTAGTYISPNPVPPICRIKLKKLNYHFSLQIHCVSAYQAVEDHHHWDVWRESGDKKSLAGNEIYLEDLDTTLTKSGDCSSNDTYNPCSKPTRAHCIFLS